MKFLCVECDEVMAIVERQLPGDGTMAAVYQCDACDREMALLTNPMETRLVSGMGIQVGGREVPPQPMELVRDNVASRREDAFVEAPKKAGQPPPTDPSGGAVDDEEPGKEPGTGENPSGAPSSEGLWSPEALERLERVPSFVRGMVKRIYADWAEQNGITRMTPETMDAARSELGLEGM